MLRLRDSTPAARGARSPRMGSKKKPKRMVIQGRRSQARTGSIFFSEDPDNKDPNSQTLPMQPRRIAEAADIAVGALTARHLRHRLNPA